MLEEISRSIEGHTVCALGDAAAWPVQGASQLITFACCSSFSDHNAAAAVVLEPSSCSFSPSPYPTHIHPSLSCTGLIRRFKHVMEDRLTNPEAYHQDKERYFQRAWSGEQFRNLQWADQHGDGKNYSWH